MLTGIFITRGAGVAVAGRIRDNGQHVLRSFYTEVVATPEISVCSALSSTKKSVLEK
jgi:hypothetical protein